MTEVGSEERGRAGLRRAGERFRLAARNLVGSFKTTTEWTGAGAVSAGSGALAGVALHQRQAEWAERFPPPPLSSTGLPA